MTGKSAVDEQRLTSSSEVVAGAESLGASMTPLELALATGPWKPRDYKVYTMKDARRAHRKQAMMYVEWKVLRKYTWRQRRFVRTRWRKSMDLAMYFAEGASREVKRELRR